MQAVCASALMQVLLLPIGRSQCLDIGAQDVDRAAAIGGRVPDAV